MPFRSCFLIVILLLAAPAFAQETIRQVSLSGALTENAGVATFSNLGVTQDGKVRIGGSVKLNLSTMGPIQARVWELRTDGQFRTIKLPSLVSLERNMPPDADVWFSWPPSISPDGRFAASASVSQRTLLLPGCPPGRVCTPFEPVVWNIDERRVARLSPSFSAENGIFPEGVATAVANSGATVIEMNGRKQSLTEWNDFKTFIAPNFPALPGTLYAVRSSLGDSVLSPYIAQPALSHDGTVFGGLDYVNRGGVIGHLGVTFRLNGSAYTEQVLTAGNVGIFGKVCAISADGNLSAATYTRDLIGGVSDAGLFGSNSEKLWGIASWFYQENGRERGIQDPQPIGVANAGYVFGVANWYEAIISPHQVLASGVYGVVMHDGEISQFQPWVIEHYGYDPGQIRDILAMTETAVSYHFIVGHESPPVTFSYLRLPKGGCPDPELDSDGDGTGDCRDECPADASRTTAGLCGCGAPLTDSDQDGVADCSDNCPGTPNADQLDADGDGEGDVCESIPPSTNTLCGNLQKEKARFAIKGTKGESFVATVSAAANIPSSGTMSFEMKGKFKKAKSLKRTGAPTLQLSLTLPVSGNYELTVAPKGSRTNAFAGAYCLTVSSSASAARTLR